MAARRNWSIDEVRATVQDYFSMLRFELEGKEYNKTAHRLELQKSLDGRTEGAIELKHQNLSAALIGMGVPYIAGYKPRFNYQRQLVDQEIAVALNQSPVLRRLIEQSAYDTPALSRPVDILSALSDPPSRSPLANSAIETADSELIYMAPRKDYLKIEAQNQMLGDAGEQFTLEFERARLIKGGKENLADKIEHIAETRGPVAGYDIRSFNLDGTDRFIESKTTKYGKYTPFYFSPNELKFSVRESNAYYLYRIFQFGKSPQLFWMNGSLSKECNYCPSEYRGVVRGSD